MRAPVIRAASVPTSTTAAMFVCTRAWDGLRCCRFSAWARVPTRPLCCRARRLAQLITKHKDALARAECQMGKPLSEANWDIDDVAGCFEYFATQVLSAACAYLV